MTRGKLAALVTSTAAAAALAGVGLAPQASAAGILPGVHFYTGTGQTGTAQQADLGKAGACQELSAPALSYTAASNQNVDVFFKPGCETGAPGKVGDLYFKTGTLNMGNFPYAAVSYRVHADAN
ncbi:hypothetical protein ACFVQ4_10620 [Streptomyces laurentii]|uniref:hypothetical protein n=1 Tax=Streptomyces laurentii TaxID=39478 RepID=UPI0036A9CCC9